MTNYPEHTVTGEQQNPIEANEASLHQLRSLGIIERPVDSCRSYAMARRIAFIHSTRPRRIVMGDCPWYWIVSPSDAERLIRAGYELLP